MAFAAAGSGSCSLAIPCLCLLARVGIPLALFVPSGLWFVCLVAVVCSPVACGSLLSVSWGCSSYHHFLPHGLPVRYSLIPPLMFRGAGGLLFFVCSLAVSTFSSALAAYRVRKEEGVVLVAVTWSVGALAPRFACVSSSGGPCCVLPHLLALVAAA